MKQNNSKEEENKHNFDMWVDIYRSHSVLWNFVGLDKWNKTTQKKKKTNIILTCEWTFIDHIVFYEILWVWTKWKHGNIIQKNIVVVHPKGI